MRTITKILAGAAGIAALAAAAPAAAQDYSRYNNGYYNGYSNSYDNGYGYNGYNNGYANTYGSYGYNGYNNGYGYNGYGAYAVNTAAAAQQCTAAVQQRLYSRTGLAGILGSLIGVNVGSGQVLSITAETPTRYGVRVDGLASSGRSSYNSYGPYGVGAYGALGYGSSSAADLSFRCNTDANGYVRSVHLYRRY